MEEIKKVEEVTESPVTNVEVEVPSPVAGAKTSYEQQAMTRRQALGRLGFLAGAAAVAALGVDDLTRLVGRKMERVAGDNETARKIAKEFSNAGVAVAAGPSACTGCGACTPSPLSFQGCRNCGGWCTGQMRYDIPCGSAGSINACRACCEFRNPQPGFDQDWCKLVGGCG
jgi:hypothetical protein